MSIPTEAIEAAARTMTRHYAAGGYIRTVDLARLALTAAAPFIQAAELRDAAEAFATGEWADAFMTGNVTDDVSAVKATDKWLNDRASQLEGKTK